MGEFFKGEQRQAGLVTLVMALALTMIWVRSYSVADVIRFVGKTKTQKLAISVDGQIVWEPFPRRPVNRVPVLVCLNRALPEIDHLLHSMREDLHISRWIIPYWSLVLPLTLFSAWLLLTKPRKARDAKESSHA